jgi:peptide/nickel transport system permease protein
MIALAIVGFPIYARLVRGVVLSLREREFVEAARALGASDRLILGRHVLPHLLSPVIVAFSLDVGAKILAPAGLSFLGLGTQPPTADWGSMLATGRQFVILSPHVVLLPGLAIFVVVLGLNLVGDALRDLLDPRADRALIRSPTRHPHGRLRPSVSWLDTQSPCRIAPVREVSPARTTAAQISANLLARPRP